MSATLEVSLPEINFDFAPPYVSPIASVDFLGEYLDERVIIDEPHLSPSHLRDRSYCAAQNWYARVHHIPKPKSSAMLRGIAVHFGLNSAFTANKTTLEAGRVHPISLDRFIHIAQRAAYQKARKELAIARNTTGLIWDRRWEKGPFSDEHTFLYDIYRAIKHIGPALYENVYPIAVEAAYLIRWRSPNLLPLLAIADIVELRADYTLGVRDEKTSLRKKSRSDLAFDRGTMTYGSAASEHYGVPLSTLTYDNITFTSPGKNAKILKPKINYHVIELPHEPRTIEALQIESADAMLDINDTRITPRRSTMTCVSCAFKTECSRDFGAIHPYILNPAAYSGAVPDEEDDHAQI